MQDLWFCISFFPPPTPFSQLEELYYACDGCLELCLPVMKQECILEEMETSSDWPSCIWRFPAVPCSYGSHPVGIIQTASTIQ